MKKKNIEKRKGDLMEEIEQKLPKFATACMKKGENIILHQDAFAADYQEEEFPLLGKAIKYAGIYKKEIQIIGENRKTLSN